MTTADDVFDAVMGYAAKEYQRGYESGRRDATYGDNPPKLICTMAWHYSDNGGSAYTCSSCGRDTYPYDKETMFCPKCGAEVVS